MVMMKKIMFVLVFWLGSFSLVLSQEDAGPWEIKEESIFKKSSIWSSDYQIPDLTFCGSDNFGNEICFEFLWKDACFEGFSYFALGEKFPHALANDKVPVLRVDGFEPINFNPSLKLALNKELEYPWDYQDDNVLWPIHYGNLVKSVTDEASIINHLFRGENLEIIFPIKKGPYLRSVVSIKNLKKLFEKYLTLVAVSKPTEIECKS